MPPTQRFAALYLKITHGVDYSQIAVSLLFRLYLANVFFSSGLTKIKTWDSTLGLFEYEYAVPLIPFQLAAYMATFAELVFPVLLAVGFASRFSAAALFILNWVAAISYPDLSPAGLNDHYFWGAMLLVLFSYGPGKLSLDHCLRQRFFKHL